MIIASINSLVNPRRPEFWKIFAGTYSGRRYSRGMGKTQPKRGRGRPQVRPNDPVGFRLEVDKGEAVEVRRAADVRGESISVFARRAVVREARRVNGKK